VTVCIAQKIWFGELKDLEITLPGIHKGELLEWLE
jgi:hypothetical protein